MNPITYLCFTLMSILMQFCLMDFTNDTIKSGKSLVDINQTNKKGNSNDIIKRITQKPHALYYRNKIGQNIKGNNSEEYPNSTITDKIFTPTDLAITEINFYYEDNSTIVDGAFTTESLLTTEFDNVTEITFLYETSTVKSIKENKLTKKRDGCACDLLFEMCDISCCCDSDCTEKEITLFDNCEKIQEDHRKNLGHEQIGCSNVAIESLFCIVKTNLPEKREIRPNQADPAVINKVYKWHTTDKLEEATVVKRTLYKFGDPILLLSRGTLKHIDIPIPLTNNYCKSRKQIRFLINEIVKCNVKLKDLHGSQVIKTSEEANIVTYLNTNNSVNLNCSSLLCANWSITVCNEEDCQSYNKQLHQPTCSRGYCSNIPYKIEYIFYCNETGILTSSLQLYVKDVSTMFEFIQQEIRVSFLMANNTSRIIKFSGNPGYVQGLPVIVSTFVNNQTQHFYNNTRKENENILLPSNNDGMCVLNQITNNKLQFGDNKKINCRFTIERIKSNNTTDVCVKIQERIKQFLRLHSDIFVSPFGKPSETEEWVLLSQINKTNVYGGYSSRDSQMLCYNVVTRLSFIIIYIDSGKNGNKIISARIVGTPRNLTMSSNENHSFVLSVDVKFIDASGPVMKVYAGAPLLSIHLPKNFFLPFY